ncbi:MAG: hypothetical protein L0Y54_15115 [Sporichthyaceae bacterium]|nr:hypothetical protein [Sporichthyaceae bacterium]
MDAPELDPDPADFIAELHDQGAWPQNAGGDPAVPDKAFADVTVYGPPPLPA